MFCLYFFIIIYDLTFVGSSDGVLLEITGSDCLQSCSSSISVQT